MARTFQLPVRTETAKLTWPCASVLLCAMVLLSPVLPFPTFTGTGYHDGQRVAIAVAYFCALVLVILRLFRRNYSLELITLTPLKVLVTLTFLGAVSALISTSPRHGFYEWANLVGMLLIAWTIAQETRFSGEYLLDRILLVCGVGCGLYIFQALVAYCSSVVNVEQAVTEHLIVGFDNYRFLNHVQTIALPLLGLLVVRGTQSDRPKYSNPTLWLVVLSLWWMLTFVSAGRGTFIAVWAGMLVVAGLYRQRAHLWVRAMALTCLAGLAAYLVLYVVVPLACGLQPFGLLLGVVQRTANTPDSSRWVLWKLAAELTAAHPLLGVGPLHFAHYASSLGLAAHPHNFLLQIASEWGLPALFALLCIVYVAVKKLIQAGQTVERDDVKNQAIFVAFLASGVAIGVDSMVSGLMVMPSSQLWITLYLGCAWGWTASRFKSSPALRYSVSWRFTFSAVLVVFCVLASLFRGLWPEVLDLPAHEVKSLELEVDVVRIQFNPRIWRAGYF